MMKKKFAPLFLIPHGFVALFLLINFSLLHAQSATQNFLVISDAHVDSGLNHTMNFSPFMLFPWNDLDTPTFQTLLGSVTNHIKLGVIPKPKFILYLGDMVGHDRLFSNAVIKNETIFFQELTTTFPHTPILYTFGNNDSLINNYGPFTSPTKGHYKTPLDVARTTKHWKGGFLSTGVICGRSHSLFPCMRSENTVDGYYSAELSPGLRLISLNSVLFSSARLAVDSPAISRQFKWLSAQLNDAERTHASVLITMHIPPGKNVMDDVAFWSPSEEKIFVRLTERYHRTIIGILAGHTHKDELKLLKNSAHKPVAVVYLVAALSTSHGNSPSVRTFYYGKQKEKWQLTNSDIFYFIKAKNKTVRLKKLYNFKAYYCMNTKKSILTCLKHLTAHQMQPYFTAGNSNYYEKIRFSKNIVVPWF